jgi:hypothetical protein
MRQASLSRLLLSCAAACLGLGGCGPKLNLGSNVLWATNHESGTLDDWSDAPGGGVMLDASGSTAAISTDFAHSGRYSLKLTDLAADDTNGPAVYRELMSPPDAYYSAWYYIPRAYTTNSEWTIQGFRWRAGSGIGHGNDLDVRALPDGQVVLYVFSHDQNYLQAPLADPPPYVPVAAWFQVETLYRPSTTQTGLLKVWLNDRLVYDLENRVTVGAIDGTLDGPIDVLWSPTDVAEDVEPAPPILYIDDAAISLTRVTTTGQLFSSQ